MQVRAALLLAGLAAAAPALAQTQLWSHLAGNQNVPSTVYGTPATRFLAADANGNVFLASEAPTGVGTCFSLKRFTASGTLSWTRSLCTDNFGTAALSVAADANGDAIVTGAVVTGYNTELRKAETDFRTVKYSGAGGDVLWERRFNGIAPAGRSFDFAQHVVVDAAGNAYVAGSTYDGQYYMLEVIKYNGATGTTIWENHAQVAGNYLVAGIALDPQGDLFVGSQINVGDGSGSSASAGPEIIKFSGVSGVMTWRRRTTSDVRMTALVVDRSGDPIAAYARGTGTNRDIYLEKRSGATGAVAWGSAWIGVGDDMPTMLATDGAGNIAVAANASNLYTVLKYLPNGDRAWQSTYALGGNAAWANAVAFDVDGNIVATGGAYDGSGYYRQRTTKHDAASGSVLWESNVGGGTKHEDSGYIVIPAAGGIYIAGYYNDIPNFDNGIRVMKLGPGGTPSAGGVNVHGLWWNPSESGWGIHLVQQGEKLFATWYAYDQDGQGMWLVMSDGARSGTNAWSGPVHRTTGPPFSSFSSGNASQVSYALVGSASFAFDGDNGTVTTTINGVPRTRTITRFQFASPVPTCTLGGSAGSAPNYTDIWWRPSESGWGVSLAHQGDILFALWYTYAPDSRGMWLVGSRLDRVGDHLYSGPLHRATGTPFTSTSWAAPAYAAVGSVTLNFTDPNNAVMDYTVNGVTQSKPITRYVFATPVSVCR